MISTCGIPHSLRDPHTEVLIIGHKVNGNFAEFSPVHVVCQEHWAWQTTDNNPSDVGTTLFIYTTETRVISAMTGTDCSTDQ